MLKAIVRNWSRLVGLAVVAGLVASAGAFGGYGNLTIFCPTSVYGGNPIYGYATGFSGEVAVNCGALPWGPLGDPFHGTEDPLGFNFMTYEYMAPGIATLKAQDSNESVIRSILIK